MRSVCMLLQNDYEMDIRVRRKAEALVAAGYSVDVLALASAARQATYQLNGVNVSTVSLGKKRGSFGRYVFEYAAFFAWVATQLPRHMRRKHYDVVDVNTLPDFLVFAAALARLAGARLLLDMHEIMPEFYMSKYGMAAGSWSVRSLTRLEKLSFDFADHVITINEPIRDLLASRGLPRWKSTVVMNAVDETLFAPSGRSSAAADALARHDRFVLMYHGTLSKLYGLDLAIEAFAMAHPAMPGAELWILGNGPERQSLDSLIHERGVAASVRLLDPVPPTEIPAWLDQCAVGVLPLRRDVFLDFAFPNKLSEYIITGKPVLVSRLNAIRHYFSEQALAYCEPNEPGDLAKQMVRLFEAPDVRARLAARARHEYAPICWDVMKERYLAVVAELADRPASRAVA